MPRTLPAVLACALLAAPAVADPDRALVTNKAIADARSLLEVRKSADAVELLEKHLPTADGNKAFLDVLRSAYAAEAARVADTDAKRAADLRTKLALLGGAPEPPPAPPAPAAGPDVLKQAATLFNEARADAKKFGLAAKLFALAFSNRVEMTPDQLAAWAYCRVRLAADQLNASKGDPAAASAVIAEVEDALRLAPANAGLQKAGGDVIAAARQRGGRATAAKATGDVVETANFRVRHQGQPALAEALAKAAEAKRGAIFSRWSGPPGGVWEPKCDVTLHASADALAKATGQPVGATGHAAVTLDAGKVTARRLDLRADDATAADDALPRELTHVVLADLFRDQAPPKWVEVGMGVLAASPTEVDRYRRTLARCYQAGELFPVESLLELSAPPADRVTGFTVESVSLVAFLVKWKGEAAFTTFVRDSRRYGVPAALKRQYGVATAKQLEDAWTQSELSVRQ